MSTGAVTAAASADALAAADARLPWAAAEGDLGVCDGAVCELADTEGSGSDVFCDGDLQLADPTDAGAPDDADCDGDCVRSYVSVAIRAVFAGTSLSMCIASAHAQSLPFTHMIVDEVEVGYSVWSVPATLVNCGANGPSLLRVVALLTTAVGAAAFVFALAFGCLRACEDDEREGTEETAQLSRAVATKRAATADKVLGVVAFVFVAQASLFALGTMLLMRGTHAAMMETAEAAEGQFWVGSAYFFVRFVVLAGVADCLMLAAAAATGLLI
ncbi:hypothetical protein NESM_000540300 [Novymonas esmeraldas]|uniref:GPI-anchored surface protein n=1 Tax=Novymonas esmeraldas TaxID=1808958 RepID=A0AAW0ES10_9TRYP